MKTTKDLNDLIPTLLELVANNEHEIGECDNPETNYICYNKDGWCIEITYECSGKFMDDPGDYWTPPFRELLSASGKVTELSAFHFDKQTNDDSWFSDDDVKELWEALDKELINVE